MLKAQRDLATDTAAVFQLDAQYATVRQQLQQRVVVANTALNTAQDAAFKAAKLSDKEWNINFDKLEFDHK